MFAVAHTAEWTPTRIFFEGHSGVVLRFFFIIVRATFYAFIYLFQHKKPIAFVWEFNLQTHIRANKICTLNTCLTNYGFDGC